MGFQHPYLGFRVPPRYVELLDWVLEGYVSNAGYSMYEHTSRRDGVLYEGLEPFMLAARCGEDLGENRHWNLYDDQWPFEIVEFASNGGDSLIYGWALLAEELDLDELPCVSYAPCDRGACWLGDKLTEALENMLVGSERGASTRSRRQSPEWKALCDAFDLRPDLARTDITAGARSTRQLVPSVPDGWRFEQAEDGIGVLAPESTFSPTPPTGHSAEPRYWLLVGVQYLRKGYPASALLALKRARRKRISEKLPDIERAMGDAYLALGRPALAACVTLWLSMRNADGAMKQTQRR